MYRGVEHFLSFLNRPTKKPIPVESINFTPERSRMTRSQAKLFSISASVSARACGALYSSSSPLREYVEAAVRIFSFHFHRSVLSAAHNGGLPFIFSAPYYNTTAKSADNRYYWKKPKCFVEKIYVQKGEFYSEKQLTFFHGYYKIIKRCECGAVIP